MFKINLKKNMTAQEKLKEFNIRECNIEKMYYDEYIVKFAKQFAKYHVEKAIQEICDKATASEYWGDSITDCELVVSKQSIINAYPLELIK